MKVVCDSCLPGGLGGSRASVTGRRSDEMASLCRARTTYIINTKATSITTACAHVFTNNCKTVKYDRGVPSAQGINDFLCSHQAGLPLQSFSCPCGRQSPLSRLVCRNRSRSSQHFLTVYSVEEYDIVTGILTLKHMYRSIDLSAKVTIEHVREGLPRSATDVGSWLNVAGYVQTITPNSISVQAIMLWEAGSLKLGDYERALQARSDAGTTTG